MVKVFLKISLCLNSETDEGSMDPSLLMPFLWNTSLSLLIQQENINPKQGADCVSPNYSCIWPCSRDFSTDFSSSEKKSWSFFPHLIISFFLLFSSERLQRRVL